MASLLFDDPTTLAQDASQDSVSYREAPCNIEAEQALLGALLVNNEALSRVGDALMAEHFYEPLHGRIFEAIRKFNDKGLVANPITLKHFFDQDQALADIGGGAYLAKLAGAAITVINISDYGRMIYDLALKRQLITIGEDIVNDAYLHQIDIPASTQLEAAEQKLFNLSIEGNGDKGFRSIRQSLIGSIQQAEYAFKNSTGVVGLTTGFTDLDKMLGGLHKSDLLILAGRPSMGKTALAVNVAQKACEALAKEAADKGKPIKEVGCVGFFSLEMSAEQLSTRMLSSFSKLNSSKILQGKMTSEEFSHLVRTSHHMSTLPFYIDDTPALTIASLRTRARRLKRQQNLRLLVVDYLQLLRGTTASSANNRVQEVSEITQGLKAIAKELDVPVIALSQLSRQVESRDDKRPLLSDLRESGSIEQDADVVLFIFREEYYLARSMPSMDDELKFSKWQEDMNRVLNVAEVIVAKHRNGAIGTVRLRFDGSLTEFSNLADGYDTTSAY